LPLVCASGKRLLAGHGQKLVIGQLRVLPSYIDPVGYRSGPHRRVPQGAQAQGVQPPGQVQEKDAACEKLDPKDMI